MIKNVSIANIIKFELNYIILFKFNFTVALYSQPVTLVIII